MSQQEVGKSESPLVNKPWGNQVQQDWLWAIGGLVAKCPEYAVSD